METIFALSSLRLLKKSRPSGEGGTRVQPRFLYSTLLSCLLLGILAQPVMPVVPLMAATSYSQSPAAITESQVLAVVNSIDRAARKGNIAGMIAPLARDVKIKMTITAPGSDQEHLLNLNKDQYALNTRQAMRRRLSYQLERKNTRVKIYDEQTASVTSDLYEALTIRQGTLRGVSSEVAIMELRNGKIVITSVESRTRLY